MVLSMGTRSLFTFSALLWIGGLSSAWQEGVEVSFQREVLPVLSRNCFPCHGSDEGSREAGLRLDTPKGSRLDLGGYQAIEWDAANASYCGASESRKDGQAVGL